MIFIFSAPPTFGNHEYEDKIVLKAGASTIIEIPFSASPEPTVEWKYNDGKLPDPRRFKDDVLAGFTTLAMAKVTKKDAGNYSLHIENANGKAAFNIRLVVLGEALQLVSYIEVES